MNENKDVSQAIAQSFQDIPSPSEQGLDIFTTFSDTSNIVPPWWSRNRDIVLSQFWKQSDAISGAISLFSTKTSSVPVYVRPVNPSIKQHQKEADLLNVILQDGSDFGGTWAASLCPRLTESYNTQDNGPFTEVIGAGPPDGQIKGLPLGLSLLDSQFCTRTGNPIFPVIYDDRNGRRYKLHHSRVMYFSSMPSPRREMFKVGFCALSRMVHNGQHLSDIAIYEQEKLGSRPHRQMIIAESGITAKEILQAFQIANESLDNSNLNRYGKNVIIGPKVPKQTSNAISISIQDLASAPDGFDKETSITLGMYTIALALNIPPRWIWPATSTGATKADAMFQHTAGLGGGIGLLLKIYKTFLERAFNGPFGFKKFEVIFDFQDDVQDEAMAQINKVRAETRKVNLEDGAIDIRVARQQMLDKGEISQVQFNRMELIDGRLPTGDSVLSLFVSTDEFMQNLLSLSVGNPLDIEENIGNTEFILEQIKARRLEAISIATNSSRLIQRDKARQAMKALDEIKKLYEVDRVDDVEEEVVQPEEIEEENEADEVN